MHNIKEAREIIEEIRQYVPASEQEHYVDLLVRLSLFVDSVERLVTHNSIKQIPALLRK